MRSRIGAVLAATLFWALVLVAPAHATFPGANGKIAFTGDRAGNDDIYTSNPDGTELTRLTDNLTADIEPRWSPDGTRIAFMRYEPVSARYQLWVMNADGTGQRMLSNERTYGPVAASWSPDGAMLVYSGAGLLFVSSSSGTWLRGVGFGDGIVLDPAWSPDGTTIALARWFWLGDDLYALPVDRSWPEALTATPSVHEAAPAWSPDSRRIAYHDDRWIGEIELSTGVRTMSRDGTDVTPISNGHIDRDPEWSPDGTRLVVSSWDAGARGFDLVTLNPDGSGRNTITQTSWNEVDPDWQPIPGPQRSDYKNSAQFCKAERDFLGDAAFTKKYGGGANAYGKCVSAK